MVERTLVLIKPDGVARGIVGRIISRFEDRGFRLAQLRQLSLTDELCDTHYVEHVAKPFYPGLKAFMMSGPLVAMVIEGDNAISIVRQMVGTTDSQQAAPGTIRGDFGLSKQENVVHASDGPESAIREIGLYFH